jgi:ABC-2 type transport system permease protein
MSSLEGTWSLTKLILRRDRFRLTVWVLVLALIPVSTASAFIGLYPDEVSRQALAATVGGSPAFTALLGPLYDASIGGLTAWRIGTLGSLFVALMAVLTMIRHTREEEETGRRELLGSTVLGRHAPLSAASFVVVGAGLLVGSILAAGLTGLGLPLTGSLAYGLAFALVALAFAGVGALSAQLTESASAARGIAVGATGFVFMLRMAGDAGASSGLGWLSWLSPHGWFSKLRPFGGEELWVLLLWVVFALVTIGVAFGISARRDVGGGAFPPRPGPANAGPGLSSPFGLAWRLQRGAFLGWALGIGALGLVYGAAGDSIGEMLESNPQFAEIFEQLGGEQAIVDTFFSVAVGIIAIISSAYAIRSVLRLQVEEEGQRAEHVLVTATPRTRWAWSHLVFGVVGPVVILAFAGALAGASYGLIIGDVSGQIPRVLGAAMIQLPAVWVLTGAVMALYGLAPRFTSVSWGLLVAFLLLGQLGQILQLPQWALDLSPFSHIPLVPAEELEALPLVLLVAVAVVLVGAGLAGVRRRDVDF